MFEMLILMTNTLCCYKLAHMTWFHATELFEDLARMGLTTASSIERAYKADRKLLWRLVSCFARAHYLLVNMWGKLTHTVTWSEYFRPYFKRWRVSVLFLLLTWRFYFTFSQTADGIAMIEKDNAYISRHGGDLLTELVVKTMTNHSHPVAFLEFTVKILVRLHLWHFQFFMEFDGN
jgi:hypothetical protein